MRTNTLLLTAALGVASTATSMAQVYSVNAVGYIKLTLPAGFTMIANQLDYGGASKNTVGNVLGSQCPDGTILYKFSPSAGYSINSYSVLGGVGSWDTPTDTLAPGEGAFIKIPAAGAPATVTFVGEVPQGTALTVALPKGFSIASSIVPQSDTLTQDGSTKGADGKPTPGLGFPAADGDIIYRFSSTSGYSIYSYSVLGGVGSWDTAPVPAVGESFFVKKAAAASWVRNFSVNQ